MDNKNILKKASPPCLDDAESDKHKYITYTDENGLVYEPGDCVYIDSHRNDVAYFICSIREIRKGKKGYLMDVLWFYRPSEIPASVYELLIQDRIVSGETIIEEQKVISRELFISDAVDSYSVKSLRGKCIIRPYFDVQQFIYSYVQEPDQWFYILKYNPDSRRLASTHGEIRIGSLHQAIIPELLPTPPDEDYLSIKCEKLIWSPSIKTLQLTQYIQASRSILSLSTYCKSNNTSDNYLDIINNDYMLEVLLETLHKNDYNPTQSLLFIADNAISITEMIFKERFSFNDTDRKNLYRGLKQYGKCFYSMKNEFFPYKKTGDLVFFYYGQKKLPQLRNSNFQNKKIRRNTFARRIKKTCSRSSSEDEYKEETKDDENEIRPIELSSYSEESDAKNAEVTHVNVENYHFNSTYYFCQNCFSKDSPNWHHAGRRGLLLCQNCRLHFFHYSVLPGARTESAELNVVSSQCQNPNLMCNYQENRSVNVMDAEVDNLQCSNKSSNHFTLNNEKSSDEIRVVKEEGCDLVFESNIDTSQINSLTLSRSSQDSNHKKHDYRMNYSYNSNENNSLEHKPAVFSTIKEYNNTETTDNDEDDEHKSVGLVSENECNKNRENEESDMVIPRRSSRFISTNISKIKKDATLSATFEQSLYQELLTKLPEYLVVEKNEEGDILSSRTSIVYKPSQQEILKRKNRAIEMKQQIKNQLKVFPPNYRKDTSKLLPPYTTDISNNSSSSYKGSQGLPSWFSYANSNPSTSNNNQMPNYFYQNSIVYYENPKSKPNEAFNQEYLQPTNINENSYKYPIGNKHWSHNQLPANSTQNTIYGNQKYENYVEATHVNDNRKHGSSVNYNDSRFEPNSPIHNNMNLHPESYSYNHHSHFTGPNNSRIRSMHSTNNDNHSPSYYGSTYNNFISTNQSSSFKIQQPPIGYNVYNSHSNYEQSLKKTPYFYSHTAQQLNSVSSNNHPNQIQKPPLISNYDSSNYTSNQSYMGLSSPNHRNWSLNVPKTTGSSSEYPFRNSSLQKKFSLCTPPSSDPANTSYASIPASKANYSSESYNSTTATSANGPLNSFSNYVHSMPQHPSASSFYSNSNFNQKYVHNFHKNNNQYLTNNNSHHVNPSK